MATTTFYKSNGTSIVATSGVDTRDADIVRYGTAYFILMSRDADNNASFKAATVVSVNSPISTKTVPV